MIKFISYDGKWPCLCMGILTIEVNGELKQLDGVMVSGGQICRNEDWDMWAEQGMWSVDLTDYPELQQHEKEITDLVNENVKYGCCGGCI